MVHCKVEELYSKKYVYLWVILSFKSGLINAIGFLTAGKFVSHVTGFGTQIGMSFGHGHVITALELCLVPLCFIFGSFLVSVILENKYDPNVPPNYPFIQFFITFLIGITTFLNYLGFFDGQQNPWADQSTLHVIFLGLLCLVCGLKNGLTTWATHGKIRTTHVTGLATDIGLHLPKFFRGRDQSRYPEKRRVNFTRMVTFLSFGFGSFITAVAYPYVGNHTLLVAFIISSILLVISNINHEQALRSLSCKLEDKNENTESRITESNFAR